MSPAREILSTPSLSPARFKAMWKHHKVLCVQCGTLIAMPTALWVGLCVGAIPLPHPEVGMVLAMISGGIVGSAALPFVGR